MAAALDWDSPHIDRLLSQLFGPSNPAAMAPAAAFSAAPRPSSPADDSGADSSALSHDDDTAAAAVAAAAGKRKGKAGLTGAGASHGPTGVEGKKGRTASGGVEAAQATRSAATTGRKGSGEPKDESKLKKRKEQNRAAQRAFRERKEKHVKDLEDKVAELSAASEGHKTENENLRDLLARLQKENVMLKQQAFTFSLPSGLVNPSSVPSNATKPPSPPASLREMPSYGSSSAGGGGGAAGSSRSSPQSSGGSSADSPPVAKGLRAVQSPPQQQQYQQQQQQQWARPPSITSSAAYPSGAGSTSSDSPASLFGLVDTPPSSVGFSSAGFNAFTAPSAADLKMPSPPAGQQQHDQPQAVFSPGNFAFSPSDFFPPPSPGGPLGSLANGDSSSQQQQQQQQQPPRSPYHMLASNPLFTSFRDPMPDGAPFDFDLPSTTVADVHGGSNGGISGGSTGQFSFYSAGSTGLPPSSSAGTSTSHTTLASPPSSQLTELFPNGFDDFLKYSATFASSQAGGGGGSGLTPAAPESAMSPELMAFFSNPPIVDGSGELTSWNALLDGAGLGSGSGGSGSGLSPESSSELTATTSPSSSGTSPSATAAAAAATAAAAGAALGEHGKCPKDQAEMLALAARPDETFGAAPAPAAEDVCAGSNALLKDPNYVPTWAREDPKVREAYFQGHIMLSADPSAKNVKLHQLWEQITRAPGYRPESFDLDSLCSEMKNKARCDGHGPVLEEKDARQILEEVPYRIRSNPIFGQWPAPAP